MNLRSYFKEISCEDLKEKWKCEKMRIILNAAGCRRFGFIVMSLLGLMEMGVWAEANDNEPPVAPGLFLSSLQVVRSPLAIQRELPAIHKESRLLRGSADVASAAETSETCWRRLRRMDLPCRRRQSLLPPVLRFHETIATGV